MPSSIIPPVGAQIAVYTTCPTASRRMSRVTASCIRSSASGPVTSHLRSGERSITTAFSRQAQYSSTAPWPLNEVGSQ